MNEKIDFVLLWVDGNDPKWLAEKNRWDPNYTPESVIRFRDWDNLQYWFRAVEKFTPWVNRIHFVTYGHLPKFLNTEHPKLHVVKHSDFLQPEVLPTFNCNPLELNLHRIPELSEQFVYFNDDMFLLKSLRPGFFFKKGLPCDRAVFNALIPNGESLFSLRANNMALVNKNFSKKNCLKRNFCKYFSLKYGLNLYRNLALIPWGQFTGFYDDHLPIAHTKTLMEEVWNSEAETLEKTTIHKFRQNDDVTNWLFRYWRYAKGNFVPCKSRGRFMEISESSMKEIEDVILNQREPMVCLNDSDPKMNFEKLKNELIKIFDKLLPNKSTFEI